MTFAPNSRSRSRPSASTLPSRAAVDVANVDEAETVASAQVGVLRRGWHVLLFFARFCFWTTDFLAVLVQCFLSTVVPLSWVSVRKLFPACSSGGGWTIRTGRITSQQPGGNILLLARKWPLALLLTVVRSPEQWFSFSFHCDKTDYNHQ